MGQPLALMWESRVPRDCRAIDSYSRLEGFHLSTSPPTPPPHHPHTPPPPPPPLPGNLPLFSLKREGKMCSDTEVSRNYPEGSKRKAKLVSICKTRSVARHLTAWKKRKLVLALVNPKKWMIYLLTLSELVILFVPRTSSKILWLFSPFFLQGSKQSPSITNCRMSLLPSSPSLRRRWSLRWSRSLLHLTSHHQHRQYNGCWVISNREYRASYGADRGIGGFNNRWGDHWSSVDWGLEVQV